MNAELTRRHWHTQTDDEGFGQIIEFMFILGLFMAVLTTGTTVATLIVLRYAGII